MAILGRREFLGRVGAVVGATVLGAPAAALAGGRRVTIFHGGPILTMNPRRPRVNAVAVQAGRIVRMGERRHVMALRRRDSRLIDLDGRVLMPGFIDSHSHRTGDWEMGGYSSPADAARTAARQGWTTISEHFASEERLLRLSRLDRKGKLPVRVNCYLPVNYEFDRFGDWWKSYRPGQKLSPRVRIAGVKVFVDNGAEGEKFLTEEYSNNPGYHGQVFWEAGELNALAAEVHGEGFQLSAHTCGDAALDRILDALTAALGSESNAAYRHRIEHLMIVRDDQITRMADLRALASFQLPWFHSGYTWQEEFEPELGPGRIGWVGRWRDFLDAGIPSIGSTDAPWGGTDGSATEAVYRAVTRRGDDGDPPTSWMRAQRIHRGEAFDLITRRGARGAFEERRKGTITRGKLADLVVLTRNPFKVSASGLRRIGAAMTMVGGKVVHLDPGHRDLLDG